MSIVHVVRQFYPLVGGLEDYVFNLANEQARQGLKVKVVTLNRSFTDNKYLPKKEKIGNLEIIRIPFWGSTRYPLAFSVYKHCKNSTIIHVHAVDFFADFFSLTKFLHQKKIILTTHGGFFHTPKNSTFKKFYFNVVTRFTIKNYNHVIACSSNDFNLFSRITNNVLLVPNGVNVSRFFSIPKNVEKGTLLTVGRIDQHKGIDRLIKVIGRLRDKGVFIRLEIIGPDSRNQEQFLKKMAQNLHVDDRVLFRGKVSEYELIDAYSKAHFFVSASNYEGFGIVAVEALASGTPCFLNKISSFEEILGDNDFGQLIDFKKINDAADIIMNRLFMNDRKYNELSLKARSYAQKYDWALTAKKIGELYGIPQFQDELIEA